MNLYFIGRGIVLKGIVKYYGSGKNIPRTFGHTAFGDAIRFSLAKPVRVYNFPSFFNVRRQRGDNL